ncbi:M56 family metallopeptidase [Dokdonia ponticola]|uniref:M56 family metallopeptidase n=1 Tax=Dokdonia ponticola TaxID=2041041 RepID=A0ABV9HX85_9FLAO
MIITYLIKSTLCLAVLFGFYKVALESKALHQFKRYYLLASLVFALTIPMVTFTYTTATIPQDIWVENFVSIQNQHTAPNPPVVIEEKTNYLPYVLWSIYGMGILIFGGRFVRNLVRLKRKITTAETHRQPGFTLALLQQTIIPHSFLKYIFLSRKRYENNEIPPEVIAHEATHVRQKHSLDILFIEFLQVVFWFNPLFWITKKSITLNHEFLADQGAIQEQHDIYQYQHILLRYASSAHHTTLESPFNYLSTKKRILMLSQSFNKKRLAISALLLIPIIAGCILVFNQGIIAQPSEKAYEEKTDPVIYARSIEITILDNSNLEVDGVKTSRKHLEKTLESLHTDLTKEQRDRVINIHVSSDETILYEDLVFIQNVATNYGYHRIVTPKEEIIRSKGNVPALQQQTAQNYATEFVEGAQRNGKKGLVVEIKNNTVRVNGKASSIKTLHSDIDAITKDWSKADYKEMSPSFLYKNSDKEFIEEVNTAFQKTKLTSQVKGLKLLPRSDQEMRSAYLFTGTRDHLEKMKNLGSLFYFNKKEISFEEAIKLTQNQKNLSIKSPYPYTNPPKTYILKETADIQELETLVIEIKNNTVRINGKLSSVATFRKDIDAITKDWSPEAYREAFPSTLVKNPDKGFVKRLNEEFLKTKFSKANGGMDLVPPPPPAPPAPPAPTQLPPPPPPPNVEDHIKSMHNIGGVFYYENENISYEKALNLVKTNKNLNVQTRSPYTNAPKTYISKEPITLFEQEQNKKPATKEDIKVYNKLAKKYGNNPNGQILKQEVAFMYDIYNRMTEKQKKNAEPYPALPPPPPPAPPAPKKLKEVSPTMDKKTSKSGGGLVGTKGLSLEDKNSFNTTVIDPSQKTIQEDARYYYNHRHISTAEAKELIARTPNIKQRIKPSKTFAKPVIFLYTSELFEPAPRPTSANIIAHIKVSNRHNSQFYYENEKITYQEALKLVRKNRSLEVITTVNEQEQYQTRISKA